MFPRDGTTTRYSEEWAIAPKESGEQVLQGDAPNQEANLKSPLFFLIWTQRAAYQLELIAPDQMLFILSVQHIFYILSYLILALKQSHSS